VGARNSFVAVPSTGLLQPRTALTVEAWIRPSRAPGTGEQAGIVSKWNAYVLRIDGRGRDDARPGFLLRFGQRSINLIADSVQVRPGKTYFLAGTYDGARARLYVDGRLVDAVTATGLLTASPYQLEIGRSGGYFDGGIAQAAVYDHALSAQQIAVHDAAAAGDALRRGPAVEVTTDRGKRVASAAVVGLVLALGLAGAQLARASAARTKASSSA
jgi:hypothetical protein